MNTKAQIGVPPKQKKKSFLGDLGNTEVVAADHMDETQLKDLNFKVKPEFHQIFKLTSVKHGLKMRELLEQSLDAWIEKHTK